MSRVGSRRRSGRGSRRSTSASRSRAASAPFSRIGWWTVVSGGSTCAATSMSSKPTMLRSRGTSRPMSRAALMAPIAIASLIARMPVGRRPALQIRAERLGPTVYGGAARDDSVGRQLDRGRLERGSIAAQPASGDARPRPARPGAPEPSGPSTARTTTSRCPRASRCSAAARAPSSSSTTTELWPGRSSESTRTIGRPAAWIWPTSGWLGRQADRHHAVDCRSPDCKRERAVERRDEVELVAESLRRLRHPLAELSEERVRERRREGLGREDAQRHRPLLGQEPCDGVRPVAERSPRPRGSASPSRPPAAPAD